MTRIFTLKKAQVILLGAVAFVIALFGLQVYGAKIPVFKHLLGLSQGKDSHVATALECTDTASATNEVYFVSCGGFF
jgi:hypothetical protein